MREGWIPEGGLTYVGSGEEEAIYSEFIPSWV